MSGDPKTLTLTLEEAMHEHRRRRQAEPYLGDVWMDHDGKWRRKAIAGPGTIHDTWPEAFSESWGVRVVARDEAAELRAALEDARERLRLILTAPEYGLGPEYIGSVALVGVDKADAVLRRLAGGES